MRRKTPGYNLSMVSLLTLLTLMSCSKSGVSVSGSGSKRTTTNEDPNSTNISATKTVDKNNNVWKSEYKQLSGLAIDIPQSELSAKNLLLSAKLTGTDPDYSLFISGDRQLTSSFAVTLPAAMASTLKELSMDQIQVTFTPTDVKGKVTGPDVVLTSDAYAKVGDNFVISLSSWGIVKVGKVSASSTSSNAPTISSVAATIASGSYKAGDTVSIGVTFSQAVTVTGTPKLNLNFGAPAQATYTSGSGSTTLIFSYTIAAGDSIDAFDYANASALNLDSGTIKNSSGTSAKSTLPTPGGSGSIAGAASIVVDTTSPSAPTLTGSVVTTSTQPTLSWSAGGGGNGTYRYKMDSSDFSSGTTTVYIASMSPSSALTNGAHTLYVQERDAAGNWSTSGSYAFTVDTTVPGAPTVTSASSVTTNNQPNWTWTSGGGTGTGYRYKLDSSDLTSGATSTATASYTPASSLTDGAHTLYVQEVSSLGNWSATGSYVVTIDTVAPSTPVVTSASPTSTSNQPTWTWTSGGGGNTNYRVKLDNSTMTSGTTALTVGTYTPASALSDGAHVLYVQESDVAGNWSNTDSYSITVDTVAPTAPNVSGTAVVTNPKPTWTWAAAGGSGGNATFRYKLDNSDLTTGATTTTATTYTPASNLTDAIHTLYVQERDTAGNWSNSGTYATTVDTTVPLAPSLDISTKVFNASFTVTASQNATTDTNFLEYRYTTTGTAPTSCSNGTASSGSISITGTSDVTLKVIACDTAGNASAVTTGTYTYDNTAPLTPSLDISSKVFNANFTVTVSQNATTDINFLEYRYTTTGTAPTSCSNGTASSGSISITGTSNVTLKVIACDSAGNYSSSITGTYTYDNTAPLTPSLDISSRNYNGSITVVVSQNASADANFLEFRYTTTGTAPTSCSNGTASSGSIPLTGTADITLKVIACDASGNASSPATGTYTYDTTPPAAPTVSGTAYVGTTTPTWTWTTGGGGGSGNYQYKLDNSDLSSGATATSTASYTPGSALTEGAHILYVQERDAAGNWSSSGSFTTTIVPSVSSVTSNTANATYGMGAVIDVRVTFSSAVTVSGTPQITMSTGGTTRYATYSSGSTTTVLVFNYTVQSGDTSSDLDYSSTSALALNGGTIKSALNDDASLTLPATGGASSLAGSKAIVIAATPPGTFSITGPAASVNSTTPSVTWGASTGATKYDLLVDNDSDCSSPTQTYSNITGTSKALTTLTAGTYYVCMTAKDNSTNYIAASNTGYSFVLDTTAPTVSSITSNTADGSYGVGSVIDVLVTFSEAVTVVGTPTIQLETGATDRTVNYVSGSGTTTLRFDYTVQTTDTTSDLNYLATSSLTAGTSIKDAAGNNATLTLPALASASSLAGSKAIVIDSTAPTVSGVNSNKTNGTYYIGDVIDVRVTFTEAVTVTGTPQITMETGTTDRAVNYVSGSGTTELLFNYTVQTGDTSSDLTYVATTSLALNSGTIKDAAGNNATLTLASPNSAGSLAANKALVISAAVPGSFTISSVTSSNARAIVNFGASSNAVTYTVKRGTSSGSYPTTLTTTATASPYIDTTVVNNTTYYYMVTAVNPNGSTNATAQGTVTVAAYTFISAGADVYAKSTVTLSDSMGTEGSASVQWTKTSGTGTITFGSDTAATTTVSASADGTYVLRLTKTDGAGTTYYDEMNLYWDTTAPTFTSVALAGPVADGTLTFVEHRSAQAIVGSVVSSGGTSTSYFVTLSTTDCSTVAATYFKLTVPTGRAAEITTDGTYKVCVRIADDADNAAVGESSTFVYDSSLTTRKTVSQIASNRGGSGTYHTCAILSDGSVRCWGNNLYGQLGYNDTTDRGKTAGSMAALAAVNIGTGRTAKSIATGGLHTCAILDTDDVKCWGYGASGRLGYGSTTSYGDGANNMSTLGTVNLGASRTAKAISLGGDFTCSILDDNSVKCWGNSWNGQVGSWYTTYSSPTAVSLGSGRTAKAISSGDAHTCAILDTDALYCWGNDSYGQLGGTNVNLGASRTAKAVSSGMQHTCAILDNNTLECWGGNGSGQLGYDDSTSRSTPGPAVNLGTGRTASAISVGNGYSCAILDDNSTKCWGAGSYGVLGGVDYATRGSTATNGMATVPAINFGSGKTATAISAGNQSACAILNTGDAKCWGYGGYGVLGQDDVLHRGGSGGSMASLTAVNLGSGRTAKSVVQGDVHACAILDDNSLKCWGKNSYGQLGQDNTTSVGNTAGSMAALAAINLGSGRTAKSVALGAQYTCAILDNDTLKCWGDNGYGQLGRDNNTTMGTTAGHMASLTAINLGTGRTAKTVSAGYATTCAILDNDTMKCWGNNSFGQMASGDTTNKGSSTGEMAALPTVGSGTLYKWVETSGYATCAVNFTNTVYCWGYYGNYNFPNAGSGTYSSPAFSYSFSPRALRFMSSAQGFSNGAYGEFCYTKDDYTGACGGQSFGGQRTFTSTKAISMLSTGGGNACAITVDGALHCWGIGTNGGLGDDYATYTGSQVSANFTAARNINLGAHTAKYVSAGANGNTCVILEDNTLRCWGYNKDGQLGYDDTYNRSGIPVSEISEIYFP